MYTRDIPFPREATTLTNLTELRLSDRMPDQELLRFKNLKDLTFRCKGNSLHLFTNLEHLFLYPGSTLLNEEECFKSLSKLKHFGARVR